MGRKAIYELPEGFYDTIIRLMKDEGMSKTEVLAELDITPAAHARFSRDNDEYREAIEIGQEFSKAWWMKQGRLNIDNKQFNVGIYAFTMKNRFKWRDTPLVVQGQERNLADKFQEKEILESFKNKKESSKDEKIVN